MSPTIRNAVEADFDATRGLLAELDALHRARVPWLLRAPSEEPRPHAYFMELIHSEDCALLVAIDGALIGAVTVRLRDAPAFPVFIQQRYAVVDDLIVAPSHRQRGIGAQLMCAAEAWARARAAAWLELAVYDFNDTARSFYAHAGYGPLTTKLHKPL